MHMQLSDASALLEMLLRTERADRLMARAHGHRATIEVI
jgi:hypothetical protein